MMLGCHWFSLLWGCPLCFQAISPEECTADSFCVTLPNPHVGAARAMLAEALLTGVVTWVVCALIIDPRCADKHDSAPLKFGFAVVALAIPGVSHSTTTVLQAKQSRQHKKILHKT